MRECRLKSGDQNFAYHHVGFSKNHCKMHSCSNYPEYSFCNSYSHSVFRTVYSWAVHAFVYFLIFVFSLSWLEKNPSGLPPKTGCCGACKSGGCRGLSGKTVVPAGMALSPVCRRVRDLPISRAPLAACRRFDVSPATYPPPSPSSHSSSGSGSDAVRWRAPRSTPDRGLQYTQRS